MPLRWRQNSQTAGESRRVVVQDRARPVLGAIVSRQHGKPAEILRQKRVQERRQKALAVSGRKENLNGLAAPLRNHALNHRDRRQGIEWQKQSARYNAISGPFQRDDTNA
jgi:hypothetical protein